MVGESMSPDQKIILFLVLYIGVSSVLHSRQVNALVNKLMSRDFHDYSFNTNLHKTLEPSKPQSIRMDDGDAEDLGALSGLN